MVAIQEDTEEGGSHKNIITNRKFKICEKKIKNKNRRLNFLLENHCINYDDYEIYDLKPSFSKMVTGFKT